MTTTTITAEQIREQLEQNQEWLERGILAIYERQTAAEQDAEQTLEHNGVGFNGADAEFMTRMAQWILKGEQYRQPLGQRLRGGQVIASIRIMKKYAGQLARIASERAEVPALVQPELPVQDDTELLEPACTADPENGPHPDEVPDEIKLKAQIKDLNEQITFDNYEGHRTGPKRKRLAEMREQLKALQSEPEPEIPLGKLMASYEDCKAKQKAYRCRTTRGQCFEVIIMNKVLAETALEFLKDYSDPEADEARAKVEADRSSLQVYLDENYDDVMTTLYETELAQLNDRLDNIQATISETRRDGYAMHGQDQPLRETKKSIELVTSLTRHI